MLVVEDDAKLSRFLVRVLVEEGFAADSCETGADAFAQASAGIYDLIILDWMLPDVDGLSVCRRLRQGGLSTPILMLTARGEVRERVLGLETGADDYLVKPFEVEELVARMRSLVRRATGFAKLSVGPLEVDRLGREVRLRGQTLDLTTREYALLVDLVHHAEKVVTRAELLARVWGTTFDPGSNLVEVHVSRLRDKLGDSASMIETVRGAGYRLTSTPVTR
ncbi:DNA-binding heavy metal response regulator [Labilithrix luteola]|uniref:DNA-binding heavy metal response regulator n=1 Tax=Labilithrix luteola TaxID=1391654 RepID=A0A0K1Q226_9BACT|nr:DNA-binding heavy metal response regulator [Labilithrix luteola]